MKKHVFFAVAFLLAMVSTKAQNDYFYATLDIKHAKELSAEFPNEVVILKQTAYEAAVQISEFAAHKLHHKILTHGPGYIRKASKEDAIRDITMRPITETAQRQNEGSYSITQDALVKTAINEVSTQNIEDHIAELQAYGTRHHSRAQGTQAAEDLKIKWETMASDYGRTDVSVRLFKHTGTNMPSVIMTIQGAQNPDEYVITGGHLDTTANISSAVAPGADDDASGIATITEAARVLFELNFVPNRTIEFMAYAAEEIGLVGSAEIASAYRAEGKNVVGVTQFDMTNFNGSANDVYFINDNTSGTLNTFLKNLLDHYNAEGEHQVTYGESACNYGCSDHASWHAEGYPAAFPFEAAFGDHNQAIHTAGDTFAVSGTAEHATKFAKLCTEFLIEVAKSSVLSVDDVIGNSLDVSVSNKTLAYSFNKAASSINSIKLFDLSGRQLLNTAVASNSGTLDLSSIATGAYVAVFTVNGEGVTSYKFILE